ncbi:MAG: DUF7948 domain-containing protein [Planctomycetota bacterium]
MLPAARFPSLGRSLPMLRRLSQTFPCLVLLAAGLAAQGQPASRQPHGGAPPALPPAFTALDGAPDHARFVARHAGLTARLTDDAIALTLAGRAPASVTEGTTGHGEAALPDARLVLRLPGAGAGTRVEAGGGATGRAHVYLGADPAGWRTDLPLVEALVYRGLPQGIELEVHGRHGRLGYDVRVPAGAALASVVITVEGADALSIDAQGRLVAETAAGRLLQRIPAAWTVAADGSREAVAVGFRLVGDDAYGFVAPDRDPGLELVVDPDLTYASFLGGAVWDRIVAVADAGDGQVLVAGFTTSADFPTTPGAQQPAMNGFAAAFVSLIDMASGTLVWSTFLGGDDPAFLVREQATCLALDASGAVPVGGWTVAADFPTTPGLGSDGLMQWSTYLGGGKDDRVTALSAGAGGVVVVGTTASDASPLFPTTPGAHDTSFNSIFFTPDGFVSRLTADGTTLSWSTFLGGVLRDEPGAVHVDSAGVVTVAGLTGSNDFPITVGAYDETYNGSTANETDAFVSRLAADGSALVWSTYLGGDVMVDARGLSVAADGGVTLAGVVAGGDFPVTPGAVQETFGGGATDAFLARLAPDASSLSWATFLGGTGDDGAQGVVADAFGLTTVVGTTASGDLPVTAGAHATAPLGGTDGFVARVSPDGSVLRYGSYLGGSADDTALALAVDVYGAAIVVGQTESSDLQRTPGAVDGTYGGGGGDGLLMRFDLPPWANRGHSKPGTGGLAPRLVGAGSLEVGSAGTLSLTDARPSSSAFLFAGFQEGSVPFKGGILVPFPTAITLVLFTSPAGTLPLGWLAWPPGIPSGFSLYFQIWVSDPGGVAGSSASNGIRGTQP